MHILWCSVFFAISYPELTTAFRYGNKKQETEKPCPEYIELEKPNSNLKFNRLSDSKYVVESCWHNKSMIFLECFEYVWEMMAREKKAVWNSQCKRKVFVIRGTRTKPGEYPHMGALGWWVIEEKKWIFMCASNLISPNFVLTAAHCFITSGKFFGKAKKPSIVRFGVNNIKNSRFEIPVDVEIEKYIVHPRYRPPEKYYDIALFKLKEPVEFTKFVQPACLWSEKNFNKHSSVTVTGWGSSKVGSISSSNLLAGELNIVEPKVCDNLLRRYRNRHWLMGLKDHQLCAASMEGGTDTCHGDSGGPIQFKLANTTKEGQIHAVLGITSFGFKCGIRNLPGIYTKVASFLDWIERIVWPDEYQDFYDF